MADYVEQFRDIINGPLQRYLELSRQLGDEVSQHALMVHEAFLRQYTCLATCSQIKKPARQEELAELLKPTADQIGEVQEYREKKRSSAFFNHLSAISESITALGWIAGLETPTSYVKEMLNAGQFYTNRVITEWKQKDLRHFEWTKAWVETLTQLQAYVKQYHTTGVTWNTQPAAAGHGGINPPPPPPPVCPPPPPPPLFDDLAQSGGGDTSDTTRSALFAQINQGEVITKNLKKVTSDMQTHKNKALREGPAPFKAAAHNQVGTVTAATSQLTIEKAPVFTRDGKKWLIEHQKGNKNLVVDQTDMNNVVYLFKCVDSIVTVKGKINSIVLDSCKKTSIVFESLVSSIEFINCQSMQMQVLGQVPTISIDKTDGCQMYLSNDSLNVEIVSSKSSEMNVLVPKGGDYVEYAVPEQYKTTVVPGKGLSTIIIENKG